MARRAPRRLRPSISPAWRSGQNPEEKVIVTLMVTDAELPIDMDVLMSEVASASPWGRICSELDGLGRLLAKFGKKIFAYIMAARLPITAYDVAVRIEAFVAITVAVAVEDIFAAEPAAATYLMEALMGAHMAELVEANEAFTVGGAFVAGLRLRGRRCLPRHGAHGMLAGVSALYWWPAELAGEAIYAAEAAAAETVAEVLTCHAAAEAAVKGLFGDGVVLVAAEAAVAKMVVFAEALTVAAPLAARDGHFEQAKGIQEFSLVLVQAPVTATANHMASSFCAQSWRARRTVALQARTPRTVRVGPIRPQGRESR